MQNKNSTQERFFEELKKNIPSNNLLANVLESSLGISKSEAYNKLKGNSSLTISQIEFLCNKYNIHFEINPQASTDSCIIKFTPFHTGNMNISEYMNSLKKVMEDLCKSGITKMICATDDIPFYHLFKYPELAAFKLHFWDNKIIKYKRNQENAIFDFTKANKKDIRTAFELHKIYQSIPSVEIWTKSHLLITIDQIKFAAESHILKDKKIGKIFCEQLIETLKDIESYAIKSSKTENTQTPFDWYSCDVIGNVTYLAELPKKNICFLRFNTFNSIQSEDESLCAEVNMWLQSLLNDATGFSGHGTKHRNAYLQSAIKTCTDLSDMFDQ